MALVLPNARERSRTNIHVAIKHPFAGVESFKTHFRPRVRLVRRRRVRHELIMHAVLGKILRATLAEARRLALPVVE